MPTYDFFCPTCKWETERTVRVADRDDQLCPKCATFKSVTTLERRLAAPLFKFAGQVTPGGGPDRFTADMLGIPLKELPDGLKV